MSLIVDTLSSIALFIEHHLKLCSSRLVSSMNVALTLDPAQYSEFAYGTAIALRRINMEHLLNQLRMYSYRALKCVRLRSERAETREKS